MFGDPGLLAALVLGRGELVVIAQESIHVASLVGKRFFLVSTLARTIGQARDLDEAYCMQLYGCTPVEYLTDLGWLGEDVWCAHCVYLSDDDVADFAGSKTGDAH